MCVKYSPLCDKDRVAYLFYLLATTDGAGLFRQFSVLSDDNGDRVGGDFVRDYLLLLAQKQGVPALVDGGRGNFLAEGEGVPARVLGGDASGEPGAGDNRGDEVRGVAAAGSVCTAGVDCEAERSGGSGERGVVSGSGQSDPGDGGCSSGRGGQVGSGPLGVLPSVFGRTLSDAESARIPVGLVGPNGGLSIGRGKNYERNAAARARKREEKRKRKADAWRGNATLKPTRSDGTFEDRKNIPNSLARPVVLQRGVYGECSDEVRRELADTRAQRYILENRRAIERLKAMDPEKERLRREKRLDTDIKFLDGQLNGDYSLCPPGRVTGWAKTLASKSSGSNSSSDKSSPSLSKGSTSPSSSVSQNERRLEKLCKELEQKLEAVELREKKYKKELDIINKALGRGREEMTDEDRYFGRDHDFERGSDDDYFY